MKKTRTSLQPIEEHYHFSRGINSKITWIFNTEETAMNCINFQYYLQLLLLFMSTFIQEFS